MLRFGFLKKHLSFIVISTLGLLAVSTALLSSNGKLESIVAQVMGGRYIIPYFANTEPAKNSTRLIVESDPRKVVGWISGKEDFVGRKVTVTVDDRSEKVVVDKGNTFTWNYAIKKTSAVCFKIDDLQRTIVLTPAVQEKQPSVFFVVDRTIYRPSQSLQFAGFLRQLDDKGEYEPLINKTVEVKLISQAKQTTAAKMKLTSDDAGRITGSYKFHDADPLDTYTLSIPDCKGTAQVVLGEFRKSKIRLKIDGEVEGRKLKVKMQGLDFTDKPVAGTRITYTTQVVKKTKKDREYSLKGSDFIYHVANPGQINPNDMPEDERLLWESEGMLFHSSVVTGAAVVAQDKGELALKGKEPGELTIDLKPEWLQGDYSITVQGVLVDQNGREQKATQSIPIVVKQRRLQLELVKSQFVVDEPIKVIAKVVDEQGNALESSAALVAMRLTGGVQQVDYMAQEYDYGWNPRAFNHRGYRPSRRLQMVQPVQNIQRTMVTTVPFKGDKSSLKLGDAGAYKLVVMAHLEDGTTLQNEVGCIVRHPDDLAGLYLKLDKEEMQSGEKLTGEIHSRFANARVLLTVRDGTGIRVCKPLQMKDSVLELNEELPANMRYGCTVEVQYVEQGEHSHLSSQTIRIVPADRMLNITTKMKDVVHPGDTVKIDVQVDRKEPVDLVVSVYDQSLLGIAPDRSVDIRNFYLADERACHLPQIEHLCKRVGDIKVSELVERARDMMKQIEKERPAEWHSLNNLISRHSSSVLYASDVAALLRIAGVDVRMNANPYGYNWHFSLHGRDGKARLAEVLTHKQADWQLHCQIINDRFLLREMHPSNPYAIWHQPMNMNWHYHLKERDVWNNYGLELQFNDMRRPMQLQRSFARGEAHVSDAISANASHSVEGQAFMSHMPANPIGLLQPDTGDSHINVRRDFSDSAFWNGTVRTNHDGKATVEFKLPDSLTNWQVVVTAVSRKMHVGQHKSKFRTFKPIMVWPMLPRVFTEGDNVQVFASVHNCTDAAQDIRVKLKVENGRVLSPEEVVVRVPAKTNLPVYWNFRAGESGHTQLLMWADCAAGSDASLKRLPVSRLAAEQCVCKSGFCKDLSKFTVPDGVDLKTACLEITFAPSLAADLADTLNFLVEYPHGCVEQTMSRFLPAIKVAQVLKQFQVEHKELNKKLPGCVEGGIKRLLELQQPDGGWCWHGQGQTHEMMSPYALYGLLQAEKAGYTIPNEKAIERGLARLQQFIQNMGDAQTSDRLYCMYVYSHRHQLQADWWKFVVQQHENKKLSDYSLALALEMAVARGDLKFARKLRDTLHESAVKGGNGHVSWKTAGFSRWGNDPFEITAVVMKALVAFDKDDPLVDNILGFFAATKRGDRWNSTKDTAMIVYAMCDYLAKQDVHNQAKNALRLQVNDQAEHKVAFESGLITKVKVPNDQIRHGENALKFLTPTTGIMYRMTLRYWKSGEEIAAMNKGIEVSRKFYLLDAKGQRKEIKSGDSVPRGSYIESEVTATGTTNMRYVLVENFKPAGCEVLAAGDERFPQTSTPYALREDRNSSVCYHHEQTPVTIQDRCMLVAELAGEFQVPPAAVELLYQTETRGHSGSFVLKVVDKSVK